MGETRAPFAPLGGKTPEEVFAASIRDKMRSLKIAAVGHTPQGFGFGRALDAEMMHNFGAELVSVEVRELINKAKSYADEECAEYLARTEEATCGFGKTPEKNRLDHARLYKAYTDFVRENGIGALASRCWPDLFTEFGTPVCTVLSLLNDEGVAAACEADLYGALSMWIGQELSGRPVFFGDPVAQGYRRRGGRASEPEDRPGHGFRLRELPFGDHLPHRPRAGRQLPLLHRGRRSA